MDPLTEAGKEQGHAGGAYGRAEKGHRQSEKPGVSPEATPRKLLEVRRGPLAAGGKSRRDGQAPAQKDKGRAERRGQGQTLGNN